LNYVSIRFEWYLLSLELSNFSKIKGEWTFLFLYLYGYDITIDFDFDGSGEGGFKSFENKNIESNKLKTQSPLDGNISKERSK
jgi:hypothetical protein